MSDSLIKPKNKYKLWENGWAYGIKLMDGTIICYGMGEHITLISERAAFARAVVKKMNSMP